MKAISSLRNGLFSSRAGERSFGFRFPLYIGKKKKALRREPDQTIRRVSAALLVGIDESDPDIMSPTLWEGG
jgi:hypothetical protein